MDSAKDAAAPGHEGPVHAAAGHPPAGHVTHPHRPRTRHRIALAVAILAGIAGGAFGLRYYLWSLNHEDTDDAFIDTHVVMISPKIEGQALKVYVDDNQRVKQGDPLVDIDPADYQVKLGQARAAVGAAEAEARKAAGDAASAKELFAKDRVSRQSYDHAAAEAEAAKAQAELARKKLDAARLDLSYARIVSPSAGKVTRKSVEIRSYVRVGQPLMAIVPDQVWVTANFKETQLTRMRPGQKAVIRVDAYPGRTFPGHVDSIQAGTGARFSLLPAENATGNYVKVVQRVPVKIAFDDPSEALPALSPGMSVVPAVDLR
ncbi:MAG: HlyD family secretion protein [Elusimicrobia bacterium]|nr:HlyD family secretion protein [Elusimicrobiota bacterium]